MDFENKDIYEAYKNGILKVLFDICNRGKMTKNEVMDMAFNGYTISEEEFETKYEEYLRVMQ